ncbi:MAG TPA: hypothetical protein VLC71_09510 [Thermomonas sp.]|nr:hypothetical protein [Thermomonas sp.]
MREPDWVPPVASNFQRAAAERAARSNAFGRSDATTRGDATPPSGVMAKATST